MTPIKVLTVCLGNICRSPAAQGIVEKIAQDERVHLKCDSAGTAAYHLGKPPDSRSIAVLAKHGIDIRSQQARQVCDVDFDEFDWILAMDNANLNDLKKRQPANSRAQLVLFGEFTKGISYGEVADPYYGEEDGFVAMKAHLSDIAMAFVKHLQHQQKG